MQVEFIKKDQAVLNPRQFECTWNEIDDQGNKHKFTYHSGIIPIKVTNAGPAVCKLTIQSQDWDFDLLINGIEIEGEPILVPPIRFQRGSNWEREER